MIEKQVRSDDDASELVILGHFGTFRDIMGQFGRLSDEFGALGRWRTVFPLISQFPPFALIFGSLNKNEFRTDGQIDPLIEMRGRSTHLKKTIVT